MVLTIQFPSPSLSQWGGFLAPTKGDRSKKARLILLGPLSRIQGEGRE